MSRLGEQTAELRRAGLAVLDQEPSAVHDTRVATRRLRSLVRRARGWAGQEPTSAIAGELAWLASSLSLARDTEVTHQRIRASMNSLDPASVPLAEREDIERALDRSRRRATDQATAAVDSPRCRQLLARLEDLVAAEPSDLPEDALDLDAQSRSLQERWHRLVKVAKRADQSPLGEHLHDIRKRAKRLRYAAEPMVPIVGKPARRFTRRLKKLQALLGEHHDTFVARDAVTRLVDELGATPTLQRIRRLEEAAAASLEREFADSWPRTVRRQAGSWPTVISPSVVQSANVEGPSAGREVG